MSFLSESAHLMPVLNTNNVKANNSNNACESLTVQRHAQIKQQREGFQP